VSAINSLYLLLALGGLAALYPAAQPSTSGIVGWLALLLAATGLFALPLVALLTNWAKLQWFALGMAKLELLLLAVLGVAVAIANAGTRDFWQPIALVFFLALPCCLSAHSLGRQRAQRAQRAGPNNSSKPTPLRGAA